MMSLKALTADALDGGIGDRRGRRLDVDDVARLAGDVVAVVVHVELGVGVIQVVTAVGVLADLVVAVLLQVPAGGRCVVGVLQLRGDLLLLAVPVL
jgi:hypothetical protein